MRLRPDLTDMPGRKPPFDWRTAVLVLLATIAGACGSNRLPTAPVSGKVQFQQQPLRFGIVLFVPNVGPMARGTIDKDGSFRLSTYHPGDGAVVGKHRIQIICNESLNPDGPPRSEEDKRERGVGASLVPAKYANYATSGLEFEVTPGSNPCLLELTD